MIQHDREEYQSSGLDPEKLGINDYFYPFIDPNYFFHGTN